MSGLGDGHHLLPAWGCVQAAQSCWLRSRSSARCASLRCTQDAAWRHVRSARIPGPRAARCRAMHQPLSGPLQTALHAGPASRAPSPCRSSWTTPSSSPPPSTPTRCWRATPASTCTWAACSLSSRRAGGAGPGAAHGRGWGHPLWVPAERGPCAGGRSTEELVPGSVARGRGRMLSCLMGAPSQPALLCSAGMPGNSQACPAVPRSCSTPPAPPTLARR